MTQRIKTALTLDAYICVSRVGGREGDSFISPDVQREKIAAFAQARGFNIAETLVDLDQSGGKLDRPEFEKALHRVEAGVSGGIVVAKLDRFARSLVGALQTIERIQAAGGVILSADGDFDTSTPVGKMVARIMLTLAEFELDRIRDNWTTAKRRAVRAASTSRAGLRPGTREATTAASCPIPWRLRSSPRPSVFGPPEPS